MIIPAVRTCPRRWSEYQRLRRDYEALGLPYPLRTFQTAEGLGMPVVNSIVNARAALLYADRRLPEDGQSWMLFLEDDVRLHSSLGQMLPFLIEFGE